MPRNLPSPSTTIRRCSGSRSAQGTSSGMLACLAKRFSSANRVRYLGLVQGSMAPSFSDFDLSGMTRSRSKSMVLPKPWLRGLVVAWGSLEDDFSGLAIADFDGIYDAGAGVSGYDQAVDQQEHWLAEVDVEQRLWGGEFE